MDASHVYVGAWALGCFHSHISTQTFRRALTASLDSCAEIKIECPFSGVTKSGRVWKKLPESDARSVLQTSSSADGRQISTSVTSVEDDRVRAAQFGWRRSNPGMEGSDHL